VNGEWVIWQDDGVPARIEKFLKVLSDFAPQFLAVPSIGRQLQQIHDWILERVTDERNTIYDLPEEPDEASTRANGYDGLRKLFEKLAAVPVWDEKQKKSLTESAWHFRYKAESLWEELPQERDYEPEDRARTHLPPTSENVDLGAFFADL
jgi:hypothetical protein